MKYSYNGKVYLEDSITHATWVILSNFKAQTCAISSARALNNLKWRIKNTPKYNIKNYQKVILELNSLKEE